MRLLQHVGPPLLLLQDSFDATVIRTPPCLDLLQDTTPQESTTGRHAPRIRADGGAAVRLAPTPGTNQRSHGSTSWWEYLGEKTERVTAGEPRRQKRT